MSDDPKFVGVPPGEDPVVAQYRDGVAARARAEGEKKRVKIPNLTEAQSQFNPKKDRPMTLGEMGQAQTIMGDAAEHADQPQQTLSDDSVRGLQALYTATSEQRGPMTEAEETDETDETEDSVEKPLPGKLSDAMESTDDLDLDLFMQRMRQDLINNEDQRKIIAARVKPMNLGDGIATGEFTQFVPIKPKTLEVLYRTVSPMEVEHIRRIVLEMELRDERLANMTVDRFSLMQMVASVVSINGKPLPTHLRNPGTIRVEFLEDPFMKKYAIISNYPGPFIHTLSTHSYWFDIRVRELFTMAELKNG